MCADHALLSQQPDVVAMDKGIRKKNIRVNDVHILRHSITCALQPTPLELQSSAYFQADRGKRRKITKNHRT